MIFRIYTLIVLLSLIIPFTAAAQYPEWQNIAPNDVVYSWAEEGDIWWIGTRYSGLISYNKATGEKKLYDKTNTPMKSSTINDVVVDKNGIKWVGTDGDGLYSFDGSSWTQILVDNKIAGPIVRDLYIDPKGTLWMGAFGLYKFDGATWTYESTSLFGLPSNSIYSLTMDQSGTLWVAAGSKIATLVGSVWNVYSSGGSLGLNFTKVNQIHVDDKNQKWFATPSGLIKFDGTTWTPYTSSNSKLPYNEVNSVTATKDGKIWINTPLGLTSFDGSVWETFKKDNGILQNILVNTLKVTNEDVLLAITSSGIHKFANGKAERISFEYNPIQSSFFQDFIIDKNDTKWLLQSPHLLSLKDNTWKKYLLPPDFRSGTISNLAYDNTGKIWITMNGAGILSLENDSLQLFKPFSLSLASSFSDIDFDKNNNLWLSTNKGFWVYDGAQWSNINSSNSSLPSDDIKNLYINSQNKKWICTSNGLAIFDDTNWKTYNTSNSSIPSNNISQVLVISDTEFYVLTVYDIVHYNGSSWTKLNSPITNFSNSPLKITKDQKGNIWTANTHGLAGFVSPTSKGFTSSNSPLIFDKVVKIAVDKDNKIWAVNEYGLSIYNQEYKVATIDQNITDFDTIILYPNPASDQIQFNNTKPMDTKIWSSTGSLVYNKRVHPNESINISNLSSGLYFVTLDDGSGRSVSLKFVKGMD